jgi:predicted transglutaminase-like cysteine proteinase
MLVPFDARLFAAAVPLIADAVPSFNVEPFSRRIAGLAQPAGDVDVCVREEREARSTPRRKRPRRASEWPLATCFVNAGA